MQNPLQHFQYVHFERLIAWILLFGMAVVTIWATFAFFQLIFNSILSADSTWDYGVFQSLFDGVLSAIIALELAHTVHQIVLGRGGLTQVRTVILIGILAVVRKLILFDMEAASAGFLAAIAAAVLALGVSYTLIVWIENRSAMGGPPSAGAEDQ